MLFGCMAVILRARRHDAILKSGVSWFETQCQGSVPSARLSALRFAALHPLSGSSPGRGGCTCCHEGRQRAQWEQRSHAEPTGICNSQLWCWTLHGWALAHHTHILGSFSIVWAVALLTLSPLAPGVPLLPFVPGSPRRPLADTESHINGMQRWMLLEQ